jgi:hypothetical protein
MLLFRSTRLSGSRRGLPPGKFPFWRPEPERCGFFQISSQKAFAAGWAQRPFTETALDYLWYFDSLEPSAFRWTDDLTPEVESRVLKAWVDSQSGARRVGR